jgi:hypothetical protein
MTTFTITEDHLKLLRCMYVGWNDCESGTPEINSKRPYGNSDVVGDVREILGRSTTCPTCGNTPSDSEEPADYDELWQLHVDTQTVLQIVLCTGEMRTGTYVQRNIYDSRSWERIGD